MQLFLEGPTGPHNISLELPPPTDTELNPPNPDNSVDQPDSEIEPETANVAYVN